MHRPTFAAFAEREPLRQSVMLRDVYHLRPEVNRSRGLVL
jgi:hypothetical protein